MVASYYDETGIRRRLRDTLGDQSLALTPEQIDAIESLFRWARTTYRSARTNPYGTAYLISIRVSGKIQLDGSQVNIAVESEGDFEVWLLDHDSASTLMHESGKVV